MRDHRNSAFPPHNGPPTTAVRGSTWAGLASLTGDGALTAFLPGKPLVPEDTEGARDVHLHDTRIGAADLTGDGPDISVRRPLRKCWCPGPHCADR